MHKNHKHAFGNLQLGPKAVHFQLETQDDFIFSFFRSRDCGCNLKEQQINVPIKLALVPLGFHESLDATRDKKGQ